MDQASEAVLKAHNGMRRRKGNVPYVLHPMEAAVIVGSMSYDRNLIAAAGKNTKL
jgi:myo-inositol-1(or 4)-monophosphatase